MTESWTDCHFTHIQYILNRISLCLVSGYHRNPDFHNRIKKKSMKASLTIQTLGAYNSLSMIARVKIYFKHIRGGRKKWATKSELVLFSFCTSRSPACGVVCSQTALPPLKHVTGLKWSKAWVCDLQEGEKSSTSRSKDRSESSHLKKRERERKKEVSMSLSSSLLSYLPLQVAGSWLEPRGILWWPR